MGDFIIGMLNAIIKGLGVVLNLLFSIFPPSPFKIINSSILKEYLPTLNFFCPVTEILGIGELWLSAITVFYLYQTISRWIKAID